MKICISSGHGKYIRGASGSPIPPQLDEVDEARRVVETVADMWREMGVEVETFHDNTSHDQGTNLETIVAAHNALHRDLDVSVHFNAYDGSAHGTEVLYVTQSSLASKVSAAIATAGPFTNRGGKYRGDLFFLNNTEEPAILLEVCFCDNTVDSNTYNANFNDVCEAIAESISGISVPDEELPPVEPPVTEPPTGENRVDIVSTVEGEVAITFNGSLVQGDSKCGNTLNIAMISGGDVTVIINGQEFHNWEAAQPTPPPFQHDIFATTFGGEADNEYSSYGPYDSQGRGPYLNDTDLYVALPYRFEGERPKVRVHRGQLSKEAAIMDVGPWMIDDPYWETGARPIAETCHDSDTELPRGPNEGTVPSNPAGIDLSPALFKALGMQTNDLVDWEFVSDTEQVA